MKRKTGSIPGWLSIAAILLSGCASSDEYDPLTEEAPAVQTELSLEELSPATDFYGYVNAETLLSMTLEDGYDSEDVLTDTYKDVKERLDSIIDEIAAEDTAYPTGSNEQLIHDLYHLAYHYCEADPEKEHADEILIEEILDRVNSASSMEELEDVWKSLAADYGFMPLFTPMIRENLYDADRNAILLMTTFPADLEKIRQGEAGAVINRDYMNDDLKLAGVSSSEAKQRATDMIYAFCEIAGHTDFSLNEEDVSYPDLYRPYTEAEINAKLTNQSFEEILQYMGFTDRFPEEMVVSDMEQLVCIDGMLTDDHLQVWKDVTLCNLFEKYGDLFPQKYSTNDFSALKSERYARSFVKNHLETQLGEIYTERYFSEEKRAAAQKMCDELKAEYYVLIENADWLSGDGRAYLKKKLDEMTFFIGGDMPHTIDPKDAEVIADTLLQSAIRMHLRQIEEERDSLFTGRDRNGFVMMPCYEVNACYIPSLNAVNVPAAILDERIFDLSQPYEWSLGAMGSILGHEISHAFDSEGVCYDAHGNYCPDGMPQQDKDAFLAMQQKAIDYYAQFKILNSPVNGKLTLAENYADISGLQACLAIAETPEKQQVVFERYAQCWCELITDTSAKEGLRYDEHSPSSVRVNAVVALFDEYYEIYDVKEGDPMYVAPEDRVRRW